MSGCDQTDRPEEEHANDASEGKVAKVAWAYGTQQGIFGPD